MNTNNPEADNSVSNMLIIEKNKKIGQAINARMLHQWLEIGKDFSNWIKGTIEYLGIEEHIDYEILWFDISGKQLAKKGESDNQKVRPHKIDYVLTLDCAKHISMIQRNEKGRQARMYFIECEKRLKTGKNGKRKLSSLKKKYVELMTEIQKHLEDTVGVIDVAIELEECCERVQNVLYCKEAYDKRIVDALYRQALKTKQRRIEKIDDMITLLKE